MTYRPGGTNRKTVMTDRINTAVAILEEAYINGNDVRIGDAYSGNVVIIEPSAIPFFIKMLIDSKVLQ